MRSRIASAAFFHHCEIRSDGRFMEWGKSAQ